MILFVTLRDTVNLGSLIVALAVGLGVIVTYFKGVRWKVEAEMRQQTIQTLEEGRNSFKERAEQLGAEKDASQKHAAELEGKIDILERLPHLDFEKQMELFDAAASRRSEQSAKVILDHLERLERRAQERHEAEVEVLNEILNGKKER